MKIQLTDTLRTEYRSMFDTCAITPARRSAAGRLVARLSANRPRYAPVADRLAMPWHVVAVIHNMEASQDFARHLHNGDPLTARTVHVPAGRPAIGAPPFSWEESAVDALMLHGLNAWRDWTVGGTLYQLERYNGMGYRLHHPSVKSPYLWSFSNHYDRGKYVADGTWSATARSDQCGAAILLRQMADEGLIAFAAAPAMHDG
ncbi:hypothetical protein [uncultured Sphingomonas sp.]|uniref:hypothetical protein n=1 Tax=uncultured Sphingomonas sp. TaxID=158754 RepID=UPI0035CBC10F